MKMERAKHSYISARKVACEYWVTARIADRPGTNTPVCQLYNAYITDNPKYYMDIGQFGKVLKARFPNRKRRRGKQGAQVYVYQDVALKESDQSSTNSHLSVSKRPEASHNQEKVSISHLLPPMVIGNISVGPILVSVGESLEGVKHRSITSKLPLKDLESSVPGGEPYRFEKSTMSGFGHNNTYTLRSKIQQENNPGGSDEFEIEIDSSQRQVSEEHLTIGQFSDKIGIDSETSSFQIVNAERNSSAEKLCLDADIANDSFKDDHPMRYMKDYRKDKTLEDPSYLTPSKDFQSDKEKGRNFSSTEEGDSGIIIDMSQFCMEQQLKSEIEVMDIPIPDEYPESNEPSETEHLKGRTGPTHTEDVVSSSTQTDRKYQSAAEDGARRMATGQQWLDANLKDMPGARTYAKDIEWAYAQDHPEEPIPESNMAVLIRGKFPGRQKRVTQNNNPVYIYQDLELVKKSTVNNTPQAPILPSNPMNPQTSRCKSYSGMYSSPQAVIVTQPNINTVVCSPPVNSIFSYQGFPCVALQVMPPMGSPPYEPSGLPNLKQNMNARPTPVNVNQSLNFNPNMSYILPNSTPAVQQLNFTPVQVQTLPPPAVHPVRLPLTPDDTTLPPAMSPLKVPAAARQNMQPVSSYHSLKMPHSQGHGTMPMRRHKTSIPPLKGPHISQTKKQQQKEASLKGSIANHQGIPAIKSKNYEESYHPDILKDKPTSSSEQANQAAKISPNTSISPLMRMIKDEPITGEENTFYMEQLKANTSMGVTQNNIPVYGSQKLKKMMEAVLPDMDVDDYISNEILESSKLSRDNSFHYQKLLESNSSIAGLGSPADYYSAQKNGFLDWREKRKDVDVPSTIVNLPKHSPMQNSFHVPEVITVLDNVMHDSSVHQEKYLNQTGINQNMNKRMRKVWDEDIRKSVNTDKADMKQQNIKHKRKYTHKKRGLFSEFKEHDAQLVDFNNSYIREPVMTYALQRDGQESKMPETFTSTRSPYTRRIRDIQSKKSSDLRNMHSGASNLQNIQDYSRTSDSLPKLQLMTTRINMSHASPGCDAKTHYTSWSNNHKSKLLSPDPRQKQAVSSVLQTARHLLKDIGPPLSETEIACRLEAALYEENPAAVYTSEQPLSHCSSDNPEAFPCSVTQALKELTRSTPDYVNQLLHHQESCHGLGCSEKCKTLKAAYTHIYIFRHRCSVWNTYVKIFSKHSRACRRIRCALALCLFMKHELHLNGISVLPIQYSEERDLLENHFRRCEKAGPHNAELQCRHLQGVDSTTVGDPNMTSGSEETKGLTGTSFVKEIRTLVDEAQQNNSTSKSVLRMLEVLTDMMRLHVYKSNVPKHGEKYLNMNND
ncbi:uncharacterized protein [Macrobrachium rosenbergii]|uniref:uncharacterized protein n=1 Tax=Macrobrachium rosenbergii TaxID=79674 RepID=UPI0034D3D9D7